MSGSKKRPKKQLPLRVKVGWIALGLIATSFFGIVRYRQSGDASLFDVNRTCVIVGLLWLAWPELETLPRWLFFTIPILAVVCAWRPQLLIVVLPSILLYWWIRPPRSRKKKEKKDV